MCRETDFTAEDSQLHAVSWLPYHLPTPKSWHQKPESQPDAGLPTDGRLTCQKLDTKLNYVSVRPEATKYTIYRIALSLSTTLCLPNGAMNFSCLIQRCAPNQTLNLTLDNH